MENGVVTVLYFFQKTRGQSLKSFHDFWDTLIVVFGVNELMA